MQFFGQPLKNFDDQLAADVLAELAEMARPLDPVILEREQAEHAAAAGMLAREFMGGHAIAQINADVFDTWVRQRGMGETLNSVVPYLAKHHPSTKMTYQPEKLKLHVKRTAVPPRAHFGARGRWACAVPCAA